MILTEKLGRTKFELVPVWKRRISAHVFDKSKVTILFHYAILKEDAAKKINKCIEKAGKVILLCYYATPLMLEKINKFEELTSYILVKDPKLKAVKSMILNESMQFKTPVASDYEDAVAEQLSFISQ